MIFLAGMLAGALALGGGLYAAERLTPEAEAQMPATWQTAGPVGGFNVAEGEAGLGPERSLGDWIRQLPAACDVQIIDRGVSFKAPIYRCPAS